MKSADITLDSYELLFLHAVAFKSEKSTYEAHFNIKYVIYSPSNFKVDFGLNINGEDEDTPFFRISVSGKFTSVAENPDILIEKHTAACMIYPYVRALAIQVLGPLGHTDMDFPLSVPFSVIAQMETIQE